MKNKLVVILIVIVSSQAQANQTVEMSYGTAKNSSGLIVYSERHISRFLKGTLHTLETKYFLPSGDQFGFIQSDFSRSSYVPNYRFEDKRHDRLAGVRWINKNPSDLVRKDTNEYVLAYSKSGKGSQREEKKFEAKSNTVTGQGLHNFLRIHLAEFKKNNGLKKEIKFLIPMNQDQYSFRIRATNYDKAKQIMSLRIEADSWLFRLMAPHIDVTYDTKKNRLLKYEGPSNLLDKNGNKINVEIGYRYDEA